MPRKQRTNIPGFGFIYQPSYKDRNGERKHSSVWWMSYKTLDGEIRRSTHQTDQAEAYNELLKMAGAKATGQLRDSSPERITIGDLLDLVLADYKQHERRTYNDLKIRVDKLRERFGALRAIELRTRHLKDFVDAMKAQERSNATINRYLANLRRGYSLGAKEDPPLVLRIPHFPMQREDNVRTGIFAHEDYLKMRNELAPHARLALIIGYHTGMRSGEILSLRWEQVDFDGGVFNLESKQVKNGRHRVAPIYGDMRAQLEMAKAERDANCPQCRHVIQYRGKRVYCIITAWEAAAKRAGVTGLKMHDLRRTALTNMEDAGVPRDVAMSISGHKTMSAYTRYLIGNAKRAVEAGKRMESHLSAMQVVENTRNKIC